MATFMRGGGSGAGAGGGGGLGAFFANLKGGLKGGKAGASPEDQASNQKLMDLASAFTGGGQKPQAEISPDDPSASAAQIMAQLLNQRVDPVALRRPMLGLRR